METGLTPIEPPKSCIVFGELKPAEHFYKPPSAKRRWNRCRECVRAQARIDAAKPSTKTRPGNVRQFINRIMDDLDGSDY